MSLLKQQRQFSLRLYRVIRKLHRCKLSNEMRFLGDRYVRDEFQRHKSASQQHLLGFFEAWVQYVEHLRSSPGMQEQHSVIGRNIAPAELSSDQQQTMDELRKALLDATSPTDASGDLGRPPDNRVDNEKSTTGP